MPPDYHLAAKNFAAEKGLTLNEAYDMCVKWFLKASLTNTKLYYLTSPKKLSKYTSLWLSDTVSEEVRVRSAEDEVSLNRVVYSALVHFLKSKKYL